MTSTNGTFKYTSAVEGMQIAPSGVAAEFALRRLSPRALRQFFAVSAF